VQRSEFNHSNPGKARDVKHGESDPGGDLKGDC
jgi:hypothetical protein